MPIKLPRLTWDLDCEPLGYPGVVFTFWLNPPIGLVSDENPKGKEPWATAFHRNMSLLLDHVTIPAEYADGEDEDLIVVISDAKALWALQHDKGFDSQLVLWASARYQDQRIERLRTAAKN